MRIDRIFVSHTSDMAIFPADRSFVRAALDAIERAETVPVDMRHFAARDVRPADYCRARVRECGVYLAVVGFRYGSIVPDEEVSYTELEFQEASAAGLPRLVFLLGDRDLPAGQADPDPGLVEQFRHRLAEAGLIVRTFTTADNLELEVFHALMALRDGVAAAAATRTLPRDTGTFTGRAYELAQLAESAGRSEIVSICAIGGMPGIGKTALAVHAAHQLATRFPDGQIFLPLHGHTPLRQPVDPADALDSLLLTAAFDARQIPHGLDMKTRMWRDYLAGRRVLLVLDDAVGSEQVRPLLPGTPGCLVLITSRRHLSGLDDADVISLDVLDPAEAAALLTRLARRPGLDARDPAVAEITRLCGFLPLAIGIMARQLCHHPAWDLATLAAELSAERNRLELLHTEDLSVAAAFDVSYRYLHAADQHLFRRLGMHPGTDIDTYAAAALDGAGLSATRRSLENLYDRFLISEPVHGRYRLHDLIREHARSLAAAEPADAQAAVSRLLDYLAHTVRSADRFLTRRTPCGTPSAIGAPPDSAPGIATRKDAITWLRAEYENLLAVVEYATAHGHPRHAVAIAAAMEGFMRVQGHWQRGLSLHGSALSAARALGDTRAEVTALTDLSYCQYLTGDFRTCASSSDRARRISQALNDQLGEANALTVLGLAQQASGEHSDAIASLTSAAQMQGAIGNQLGEAHALDDLGTAQEVTADYLAAIASRTGALELYRRLRYQPGEASALIGLGAARRLTGQYSTAAIDFRQAMDICQGLGDRLGEACVRLELGAIELVTGDYAAATESLGLALQLYRDLGDRLGEAGALNQLALVQHATANYADALTSLSRALQLYSDLGSRLGEANALGDLSLVHHAMGDHVAAAASATAALNQYRDLGNQHGQARVLHQLGISRQASGDHEAAAANMAEALRLFRAVGDPSGEAQALNSSGELALVRGDVAQARTHHLQAMTIAETVPSDPERARALEGIGHSHLAEGHLAEGTAQLRQALTIYQRIGSPRAQEVRSTLWRASAGQQPTSTEQTHGQ